MKRVARVFAVVTLLFTLVLTDPLIAQAVMTGTAANIDEVVNIVTEGGLNRENVVKIDYTGDEAEIDRLSMIPYGGDMQFFYGLMAVKDDPATSDDADYLVGSMQYSKLRIDYENRQLIFNLNYFETLEQTQYVNSHVSEILDKLGVAYMSNYDKVKTIHDYVSDLISYTNTGELYENAAYGAFKYGKALCNAYALCFYKLCVEAGVPCKYIGGYAGTGRDAGGHAWNIVALGDKWYFVDPTWDDTDDVLSYEYFLKGTEDFDENDPAEGHFMDPPYYRAPFRNIFPIARTAFEEGNPDENNLITVAGTNPGNKDPEVTYTKDDIYLMTYPQKKKFTVRKNRMVDLSIILADDRAAALVCDVRVHFDKGLSNVKKLTNYGIMQDRETGLWFTDLELYGKKKGKVKITIQLFLVNGQKMNIKFTGKIKK